MAKVEKYYLRLNERAQWQRVTKEAFIAAERAAGFRPKLPTTDPAYATTCATGGFGSSGSVQGQIRYEEEDVPVTSARNVGELRRLIEGVPDNVPLVSSAYDHEYRGANADLRTALKGKGTLTEDHGEEITPESEWGERVQVLFVG